jgi:hypothetical protein
MQRPCELSGVEIHVAWLYSTALKLEEVRAAAIRARRSAALIQRLLRKAEVFRGVVADLESRSVDPDLALDVAAVLGRALRVWRTNVERWPSEARCLALASAAAEVVNAADLLQDWLVSRPWVAEETDVEAMTRLPRRVQ